MKEIDAIRQALRSNPRMAETLGRMAGEGRLTAYGPADRSKALRVVLTQQVDVQVPIDGATWLRCEHCRAACSVAPDTQKMLEVHRGPTDLICMRCLMKEQQAAPTRIS